MHSSTMFEIVFLEENILMWNKFEVSLQSYGYGHEDANKNELYILKRSKKMLIPRVI